MTRGVQNNLAGPTKNGWAGIVKIRDPGGPTGKMPAAMARQKANLRFSLWFSEAVPNRLHRFGMVPPLSDHRALRSVGLASLGKAPSANPDEVETGQLFDRSGELTRGGRSVFNVVFKGHRGNL